MLKRTGIPEDHSFSQPKERAIPLYIVVLDQFLGALLAQQNIKNQENVL